MNANASEKFVKVRRRRSAPPSSVQPASFLSEVMVPTLPTGLARPDRSSAGAEVAGIERVGVADVHLGAVVDAVAIGVRGTGIRPQFGLLAVGEPVAVGVRGGRVRVE